MVTPLVEDIPDTATQDKIKQVGNLCLYHSYIYIYNVVSLGQVTS